MADKQFPTTEAELNLLLQSLNTKLPTYSATLGITAPEMTSLSYDAVNFNYIINFAQLVNDSKDAFFAFKEDLIDGEVSNIELPIPTFPTVSMPEAALPGIKKRLRSLLKRIKSAPAYTEQIGEDLGLVEKDASGFNPDDLFAELKPRAISNGRVEISFSKQGMDAMRVEFKRKGESSWSLASVFTASPGIHDAPSVPPDTPESREYRGILIKKNDPIGNMSPSYTIVTTP